MPKARQSRMDSFIRASPKKISASSSSASPSKRLRQATIQSLKRVVNVDHITRCKHILQNPNEDKAVLLSTLGELEEKIPSREVLQSTKIGHTVRKLLKHKDVEISHCAMQIYKKWKKFFMNQSALKTIDVKCSLTTENCRRSARTHLAKTLAVEPDHESVVKFEREAFHILKTLTLHQYKRILRAIVIKAKTDELLKTEILQQKKESIRNRQSI